MYFRSTISSPPPRPEDVAGTLEFPDGFASAVQLEDTLALVTGDQDVTVGQAGRRRRHGGVHFQEHFPFRVVLGHLVAIRLRDEDTAVRQQVDTARPAGIAVGGKTLELLTGRVHDDALAVL